MTPVASSPSNAYFYGYLCAAKHVAVARFYMTTNSSPWKTASPEGPLNQACEPVGQAVAVLESRITRLDSPDNIRQSSHPVIGIRVKSLTRKDKDLVNRHRFVISAHRTQTIFTGPVEGRGFIPGISRSDPNPHLLRLFTCAKWGPQVNGEGSFGDRSCVFSRHSPLATSHSPLFPAERTKIERRGKS